MVRQSAPAMEPTFYEEHYPATQPERLKLTLDLKRPRGIFENPILSSPDLNLLKIPSPELERLIMQSGFAGSTPTPGTEQLFVATPTEAQKQYARPFEDALNILHSNPPSVYADLDGGRYPAIKDEPQTVPSAASSPPMSPIVAVDMESQEKIKLERKRQRNRVAASKCRRRKLERISRLEDKVKQLKGENSDLSGLVVRLKDQVCRLKQQVMRHVQSGCQVDHSF